MKQVSVSVNASKTLTRLPANTARLIRKKIEQYATDPEALANNVKALKGAKGVLRLRVGDWRVLFREDAASVAVLAIGPRGSIYDE